MVYTYLYVYIYVCVYKYKNAYLSIYLAIYLYKYQENQNPKVGLCAHAILPCSIHSLPQLARGREGRQQQRSSETVKERVKILEKEKAITQQLYVLTLPRRGAYHI